MLSWGKCGALLHHQGLAPYYCRPGPAGSYCPMNDRAQLAHGGSWDSIQQGRCKHGGRVTEHGDSVQVSHLRPLLVGPGGSGERWCQVRLKTAPWATGWRASLDLRLRSDPGLRAGEAGAAADAAAPGFHAHQGLPRVEYNNRVSCLKPAADVIPQ
jgi:hypothetical protein